MKKLTIILALALMLVLIAPAANSSEIKKSFEQKETHNSIIQLIIDLRKAEEDKIKTQKINNDIRVRAEKINNRIEELNTYVGKTWYVFSGSSPKGWDCSGLVKWFYSDLGYDLYHSATAQKYAGEIVSEPMVGDIVSFSYRGSEKSYHNGIYVGDGKIVHSPRPGKKTQIRLIDDINSSNIVTYTRIIPYVLDY
jgi:cell wall-associated NlpC family hydrolase